MESVIKWIKKNRIETIIIILIIVTASFLRFFKLEEYMTFLGDEGRDALIVKDILVEHIIPSIGPPSSVGNIYLGPLYYYMMAVAMGIFWLNPVAAAGMVALIGVFSVGLIYYLARVWFGMWSAIVAASLYALSFVTITYSRSSWNPNPAPFFALIAIFSFYKARETKNFLWLTLTGISIASAIQMHYLSLILVPIFGLLWLFEIKDQMKVNKYRNFLTGTFLAVISFIFVMLPLILFDFRHNFLNYRGIVTLFTERDSSVGFNIFASLSKIPSIFIEKLNGRYLSGENLAVSILVSVAVLLPLILYLYRIFYKKLTDSWPLFALCIWLLVGLLGISLFKLEIYDHYLGYLSPVPFLLIGAFVNELGEKLKMGIAVIIVLILGFLNLQKDMLLRPANNQFIRTKEISEFVINETGDKPFNFALISARNYDSAYQFFFEILGYPPKVVPIDITDQLLVVCEDPVCSPVGNPKYEIAGFGWALIDKETYFDGVRIYRLIHNPAQPK